MDVDEIVLDLDLDCIVGILPRERVEPQRLEIAVRMGIDLEPCATTGDLGTSVNYADVDATCRALAGHGRFKLLEPLGLAILRFILAPPGPGEARGPLEWAEVTFGKPQVMPRAKPGVRMRRRASEVPMDAHDVSAGVQVQVLADLEEVRAERVLVAEGASHPVSEGSHVAFAQVRDGAIHGPATALVVLACEI